MESGLYKEEFQLSEGMFYQIFVVVDEFSGKNNSNKTSEGR